MHLAAALIALAPLAQAEPATPPPDRVIASFFDAAEPDRWITVNDDVMGGRSSGGPAFADGLLTFSGSTNTNGGGFSSIRTRPQEWGLADAGGLLLRVRGDGRTYIASMTTDERVSRGAVNYWQEFETTDGQWQTLRLPFAEFTPTTYGMDITGRVAPLDASETDTIGFYIYDKLDGPFQLDVAWIGVYADDSAARSESESVQGTDRMLSALNQAINRGAPRFNHGDHGACADIYETALTMMLAAGSDLPAPAVLAAERGLRDGQAAHSQTDRAWAYRRAIDDIAHTLADDDGTRPGREQ